MLDFKEKISEEISKITKIDKNELYEYIEMPSDNKMGDYAFPCFRLAKTMKKSPIPETKRSIAFMIKIQEKSAPI